MGQGGAEGRLATRSRRRHVRSLDSLELPLNGHPLSSPALPRTACGAARLPPPTLAAKFAAAKPADGCTSEGRQACSTGR